MKPRRCTPLALLLIAVSPAAAQAPSEAFTVLLGEGDVAAIRTDTTGNIYVLGASDSGELPTKSAFQPDLAPGDCDERPGSEAPCPDLFLAKLTRDGQLVYLTYLGGSSEERAIDLAVDSAGAVYVLGHTISTDFPGTASLIGAPPGVYIGSFLAKVSPDGQSLLDAVTLPESSRALALDGVTPIIAGTAEYVPLVGGTLPPIGNAAFFVGFDGEVRVKNSGLKGPIVDVAALGDRLFALAYDVFVSNDGGESWAPSGVASQREDWMLDGIAGRGVVGAPNDPDTLYATAQGKLLTTRNGGAAWTDVTPAAPDGFKYAPGPVAAGSGGRVYTANNQGGVYRSDDYGATWTADHSSSYVVRLLVDPANPDLVFAQRSEPHSYGAGLRFSADGGKTWDERAFPTFSFGRQLGAASLMLDPSNSAHLYGLFRDEFYESEDGGRTWQSLGFLPAEARAVEVSPGEPGVFYGLTTSGVVLSEDGGLTWQQVEGFTPREYTAIAVDPHDPATLYVSARGSRQDGFLLRLAADLRSVTASARFGGFGSDLPQAMLAESSGDLLVGGVTDSLDFPSATSYGGGATDFFLAPLLLDRPDPNGRNAARRRWRRSGLEARGRAGRRHLFRRRFFVD